MAWLNVLAGSFIAGGRHHYGDGQFRLLTTEKPHAGEDISVSELTELAPADPRSERLFAALQTPHRPVHWVISPIRTLMRILPNDPTTTITFRAKFNDGRRMIANTDIETFCDIDSALKELRHRTPELPISNISHIHPVNSATDLTDEQARTDEPRRDSPPVTPMRKA